MIIGAFYWALLVFGGTVVLLSGLGVLAQLQDQHVDVGSVGFTLAFGGVGGVIATYSGRALIRGDAGFFGVRAGPAFSTNRMASSGCLFVILVVGSGLLLYGPMALVQLPSMAGEDQRTFGAGAVVSSFVGALLVAVSGFLLWHRRVRSPSAAGSEPGESSRDGSDQSHRGRTQQREHPEDPDR